MAPEQKTGAAPGVIGRPAGARHGTIGRVPFGADLQVPLDTRDAIGPVCARVADIDQKTRADVSVPCPLRNLLPAWTEIEAPFGRLARPSALVGAGW